MTTPTTAIVLEADEADELAFLLAKLEDWLRHASDEAHADLASFLDGAGCGVLAAAGLVDRLGAHTAVLHRRIQQVVRP